MSPLYALLALSAPASAEPSVDAHHLHPAWQGNATLDPVAVWRAQRQIRGTFSANLLFDFTDEPAVQVTRYWPSHDPELVEDVLLDDVLAANLGVAYAAHERVGIALQAPIFLGSDGTLGAGGVAAGDLRLSLPVGLVLPGEDRGFALSVIPHLSVPTGASARLLGAGVFSGGGTVAAGYGNRVLSVDGNVGISSGPQVALPSIADGSRLNWGVGAAVAPPTSPSTAARSPSAARCAT